MMKMTWVKYNFFHLPIPKCCTHGSYHTKYANVDSKNCVVRLHDWNGISEMKTEYSQVVSTLPLTRNQQKCKKLKIIIIVFVIAIILILSLVFISELGYKRNNSKPVKNKVKRFVDQQNSKIHFEHHGMTTKICVNSTKRPFCLTETCSKPETVHGNWINNYSEQYRMIQLENDIIRVTETFRSKIKVHIVMYHSLSENYGFILYKNDESWIQSVYNNNNNDDRTAVNSDCKIVRKSRRYRFQHLNGTFIRSELLCEDNAVTLQRNDRVTVQFLGQACLADKPFILFENMFSLLTTSTINYRTPPINHKAKESDDSLKLKPKLTGFDNRWFILLSPLFVLFIVLGYEFSKCFHFNIISRRVENIVYQYCEEDWLSELLIGLPDYVEEDPKNITIERELGSGNYGVVNKGVLRRQNLPGSELEVAVKAPRRMGRGMVKGDDLYCLDIELKILLYIGNHENIIKLVGAITKPCYLGLYVVITELCKYGNLETYISERASQFYGSEGIEICDIIEHCKLCLPALLAYAMQIANGAYFLSVHKTLIHRDFALRNMLLTEDHIVKINDFGLAVKGPKYQVNHRKQLPFPWLPPESLNPDSQIFTSQSDIWSFGVLLWEMFTLAKDPCKITPLNGPLEFRNWLLSDNRLPRPHFATEKVNQLMNDCWNIQPLKRPTFLYAREILQFEFAPWGRTTIEANMSSPSSTIIGASHAVWRFTPENVPS